MPQVLGQRLAMKPGIDFSLQAALWPRSHGTGTSFSALELAIVYYSCILYKKNTCNVMNTGMATEAALNRLLF